MCVCRDPNDDFPEKGIPLLMVVVSSSRFDATTGCQDWCGGLSENTFIIVYITFIRGCTRNQTAHISALGTILYNEMNPGARSPTLSMRVLFFEPSI